MKEEEFEPVLSSDDISMNYKSKVHKARPDNQRGSHRKRHL